uniref:HPr kinase n=1 Tax=Desulfobacca acetoxidans TaxID=60893 RepID=A0A7C3UW96_9BACT
MSLSVKVADLILTAVSLHPSINLKLSDQYLPFLSSDGQTDIAFHFLYAHLPSFQKARLIFNSQGSYRIYQHQEKYLIPLGKGDPQRLAAFDLGFTQGEIYSSPQHFLPSQSPFDIYLFEHPLDQLALVNYLAPKHGALMHASGMAVENQGLLFVGMSGAGKSTIAKIWQAITAEKLLNDDRIIIRRRHGSLRMYGTPWPGEAQISSPDSAPLKHIFFLEKAPHNSIRPLSPMEAATRLLACSFPPLYSRDGMESIIEFFSQVVTEIPCYELNFVPDRNVVDFILGVM